MSRSPAREKTHIHATDINPAAGAQDDRVARLAARMSRTEPDIPSIDTPLDHERNITVQHRHETQPPRRGERDRQPDQGRPTAEPQHVTAVLGPRPDAEHPNRQTWDHTAATIERYRTRYDIPATETSALGAQPPAGRFAQRHDQKQAAQEVHDAIRQLNPAERQLDRGDDQPDRSSDGPARHIPELIRAEPQHEQDRTPGWEP